MFFAILDSRTAEMGMEKVTSHLEEIAFEALEADMAFLCDVIGNALADEAASLAAKRLRPAPVTCKESQLLHKKTFLICIRLAFTQARVWAMMGEARLYEDPPDHEEAEADIGSEFQKLEDDFAKQGHELIEAWRGKQSGHKCIHCRKFQAKKKSTAG